MKIFEYIVRVIPAIFTVISLAFSLPSAGEERLAIEIEDQKNRIASLESAYDNGEIPAADMSAFYNGDLQADIENGIKFNELRYTATHNSYQTESVEELKEIYRNLSYVTFGLVPADIADFFSPTLTDQLNSGILSFEIDIEAVEKKGEELFFTCMHNPNAQQTTSCYDFSLALKEIAMWSDNNPDHLPITVIIEPKEFFIPADGYKIFDSKYIEEFDAVLRENLGDKLFTPADMMRNYESFGEMRAADDWCEVKDMLGKVLILFHECNATEKYIKLDPSLRSQAMFPMLRANDADRDCASFLIINDPKKCEREYYIDEKKLMVRTRADTFSSVSETKRKNAFECGAQIISTDYPVKNGLTADDYVVSFENLKTISR